MRAGLALLGMLFGLAWLLTEANKPAVTPGEELFRRRFTVEEGLGPLFNGVSCAECHEAPLGGVGEEIELHAEVAFCIADVIQTRAVEGAVLEPQEGAVERVVPDLFGMQRIDGIGDQDIKNFAAAHSAGGRPHILPDGRVGKFGRKAIVATLDEFTGGAFFLESGITNGIFTDDDSIPDPELVDPIPATEFMRTLMLEELDSPQDKQAERGFHIFNAVGCAFCHVPEWAGTDILLHDIGTGEGDICILDAEPGEFRTEPLMGLRFAKRRGRGFLHDGRAKTLEEAIEMHAGQAAFSTGMFRALGPPERAALLHYLRRL